jgi:hypothetical protein
MIIFCIKLDVVYPIDSISYFFNNMFNLHIQNICQKKYQNPEEQRQKMTEFLNIKSHVQSIYSLSLLLFFREIDINFFIDRITRIL